MPSHAMPFGAELRADGSVRFRLWAPKHAQVALALEDAAPVPMRALEEGWHELVTADARAGTRYRFVLPDGLRVPDPASRYQPEGVHGPSEVIDPRAYRWRDDGWKGRPWTEAVVYELHAGAFSPEGTFRGIAERLGHLVALGVTALELMPIASFPGRRNWGYDGVLWYAPQTTYGRPDDLKALVDAAHARGVMVLLDVVYNHFGPDGNYLSAYAPQFFTARHKTPWGDAIDYEDAASRPVREFAIHNALYWLEEYRLDGLRLDAVHAILDDSAKHILDELAERVRAAFPQHPVHLVLENEENEARRLVRDGGAPRWYTAQWNDDVHHVLHVAATGEATGYYEDYKGDPNKLGRALAEGFAFQGETMPYRDGPRGEPTVGLTPDAFVAFAQNHDQVGNRAFGERIDALAPAPAVRAITATYLLLPQVPMLFMGEEWAAPEPFPFFSDFAGELGRLVREGRRQEFARFPQFADPGIRERIPDPQAEATFASAQLDWEAPRRGEHAARLAWYRELLAVRREAIVPRLPRTALGRYEVRDTAVVVAWPCGLDERLVLAANLSAIPAPGVPKATGRVLWLEGSAGAEGGLGPWSVRWTLEGPGTGA